MVSTLAVAWTPAAGAQAEGAWIVSFADHVDDGQRARLLTEAPSARFYTLIPAAFVPPGEATRQELESLDFVTRVDPNAAVAPELDRSRPMLRLDAALAAVPLESGVPVAVIDSGIDAQHPALAGRVAASVTITADGVVGGAHDETGHGTALASVVAGTGGSSPDGFYAGLDPAGTLIAVDLGDQWTVDGLIRAVQWVVENRQAHGIGVVLIGLGRTTGASAYDASDPLARAVSEAAGDLVVVTSAGNRGPARASMANEALAPAVVAVGAVGPTGAASAATSRGPAGVLKPDVWAPGVDVIAASPHDPIARNDGATDRNAAPQWYSSHTGTSIAAAHVAAVAAMYRAAYPNASAAETVDALRAGVVAVPDDLDVRMVDAELVLRGPQGFAGGTATVVHEAVRRTGTGVEQVRVDVPVAVWTRSGSVSGSWVNADWSLTSPSGAVVHASLLGTRAQFVLPSSPQPGLWVVRASALDVAPPGSDLVVTSRLMQDRPAAWVPGVPIQDPPPEVDESPDSVIPGAAWLVGVAACVLVALARRRQS
jgi:subtilisin family serine protease